VDGLVERVIEYMKTDCALKPLYRERIDAFYAYRDQSNCERVYNKILELEDVR